MTHYVYATSGRPVGYIRGCYIHALSGTAIGQLNGTHVHKNSGPYVGGCTTARSLTVTWGTSGTSGTLATPGTPGILATRDRGNRGCPYRDVFDKLLTR